VTPDQVRLGQLVLDAGLADVPESELLGLLLDLAARR
jgi:hypothetical protein